MGAIADLVVILGMLSLDAEANTECQLFTRILHVGQHDFSSYRLSSNIGIPYAIKCAAYCKMEDCLSFSYEEETMTCDTFSRPIGEEDNAGVSTPPVYYSKVTELNSCGKLPIGSPSGIYSITLKSGDVQTLFCDVDTAGGPWTVIQKRTLGNADFYRNWSDYQSGFGDLNGDFWIV
ncbi:fibrinogen-like protein A [Argopecten irradians]|uniref:fibrinogen-like protein A n=1 Tax=Argopecten irradians TaxID=31199 RepID=UPI00371F9D09